MSPTQFYACQLIVVQFEIYSNVRYAHECAHESIEAIDRLSKLMIGWVLEYDGINVSTTLDFLIEVKNEKMFSHFE